MYSQTVTAVPFRRCDNKNLGISEMCDFSAAGTDGFANPPIFGYQVMAEYGGELPSYLKGQYESNIRRWESEEACKYPSSSTQRSSQVLLGRGRRDLQQLGQVGHGLRRLLNSQSEAKTLDFSKLLSKILLLKNAGHCESPLLL